MADTDCIISLPRSLSVLSMIMKLHLQLQRTVYYKKTVESTTSFLKTARQR